jgi:prepilin-type N-terminal cleavage/methylation domain-containing protein
MRRKNSGFTLLEVVVVLAIVALLAAYTLHQGRAVNQAAGFAGGAWELSLRASSLRARALANAKDYLLVVVDTADADGCVVNQVKCGKAVVYSSPLAAFSINGFDPDAPTNVSYEEELRLPRNSKFDLGSTWVAPAPFGAVTGMDPALLANCAGGRKCFAVRYRSNGEVAPEVPSPPLSAERAGFGFVMKPWTSDAKAQEKRAIFISFPTGIVKTAAFSY